MSGDQPPAKKLKKNPNNINKKTFSNNLRYLQNYYWSNDMFDTYGLNSFEDVDNDYVSSLVSLTEYFWGCETQENKNNLIHLTSRVNWFTKNLDLDTETKKKQVFNHYNTYKPPPIQLLNVNLDDKYTLSNGTPIKRIKFYKFLEKGDSKFQKMVEYSNSNVTISSHIHGKLVRDGMLLALMSKSRNTTSYVSLQKAIGKIYEQYGELITKYENYFRNMFYGEEIWENYPVDLDLDLYLDLDLDFPEKPNSEVEQQSIQNIIVELPEDPKEDLNDEEYLNKIYEELMQGMYDTTEGASATENSGGSLGGMAIPASLGIALTFISCTLGSISWN
jgi:hypothetical protein